MGTTVWARDWGSGELSNTTQFQPFKMNKNVQLKAIRTQILIYNNPTFTNINCKIYTDDYQNGVHSPGVLLATSTDSRTKADMTSEDYGAIETYFNFDKIALNEATWYNVVINGTGYSPTASSYLAWVKAYPDPVLTTDYTPLPITIEWAPFEVYPIWSRF